MMLLLSWRERDMVRVRMVVSSEVVEEGMVEIAVAWWKCFFSAQH